MKPAAFEYFQPETIDEALALLSEHGTDAKPLAGGQSLIPAMNFRLASPAVLVDLNALDALAYIDQGATLRLGAMTRQRSIERSETVKKHAPLLAEAMPFVAHAAIRNRGTVGGSLAHADPAAELPAVMLALDARFELQSSAGSRTIAANDFFVGLFATAIQPGEVLTHIEVASPLPHTGYAFQEISRRHGDFALVGVATAVTLTADKRCAGARIALLSVGDRPMLAERGSALLKGELPTAAAIAAAAETAAREDIDPPSDIHASAKYRRRLATVLTRRALTRAFERATL